MMEVTKVFFTDDEKAKWLRDNEFTVIDREVTEYINEYHNRTVPVKVIKPMVVIEGRYYRVDTVFKQFFEHQYKKIFTPVNLETRRNISRIIKKLRNGNRNN